MERNEVAEKYKWKIEDIYPDDEAWERDYAAAEGKLDFSAYRGTLNTAENVLAYLRAEEEIERKIQKLYIYAHMKHDEDVRNTKYGAYLNKTVAVFSRLGAETAFFTPELTALDDKTLLALAGDKRLEDYDYTLKRLIAEKKYILTEKEEKLLALAQEPLQVAGEAFNMLDNAELNLPEIEYEGKKQQLTHGLYSVIINGKDREKRKEAFTLYYGAYRKILNTLAITYYGNVRSDIFVKNARGFDSCLSMALFQEDVEPGVYAALLNAVHKGLPVMHRYMQVRKEALGYDEMHMYDIYPSLVEDAELKLSYEEAYELVLKGLAPLGKEYGELLKKGRDGRWIDVMETTGKRSGAYSICAFGTHPFVLLNYQKTTHDVFTIAHEMGHSIHSYFSCAKQPYAKSDYKIFVAEVASTVNEVLLLKYLLSSTKDKKLKKYLLGYYMDMIRTTLFRQTQFAEFEEQAHAKAEAGEPLNKDNLTELYYGLNKQYYGDAVTHDEEIGFEWSRIPHFYNSFYVYKYATGITAAICIAERILREGQSAVNDYFAFLSGGSSTDPVSLLRLAGADLTKEETFTAAMQSFSDALEEFVTL